MNLAAALLLAQSAAAIVPAHDPPGPQTRVRGLDLGREGCVEGREGSTPGPHPAFGHLYGENASGLEVFRYYDPASGRYLSVESIFRRPNWIKWYQHGGTQVNPYAYAVGNPIRWIDTDGKYPRPAGLPGAGLGGMSGPYGAGMGAFVLAWAAGWEMVGNALVDGMMRAGARDCPQASAGGGGGDDNVIRGRIPWAGESEGPGPEAETEPESGGLGDLIYCTRTAFIIYRRAIAEGWDQERARQYALEAYRDCMGR